VITEGDVTREGIQWRTNPYTGKGRVQEDGSGAEGAGQAAKAIDVDVLALQEVENIEALEAFVTRTSSQPEEAPNRLAAWPSSG
jgi:hypothetical protein